MFGSIYSFVFGFGVGIIVSMVMVWLFSPKRRVRNEDLET